MRVNFVNESYSAQRRSIKQGIVIETPCIYTCLCSYFVKLKGEKNVYGRCKKKKEKDTSLFFDEEGAKKTMKEKKEKTTNDKRFIP